MLTHTHTHTHSHSATKLENLTSFLTQPQRVLCLPDIPGNPAAAWPCSLVKHSLRVKVKVFNHMSSLDLTWVRRCAGLGARCPVGFFDSCRTWLINVAPPSPPFLVLLKKNHSLTTCSAATICVGGGRKLCESVESTGKLRVFSFLLLTLSSLSLLVSHCSACAQHVINCMYVRRKQLLE